MGRDHCRISIDLTRQALRLCPAAGADREYPVSTAKNGPGELLDSGCTPRGRHSVAALIGAGRPVNTVFVGRRPTGEIYGPELRRRCPGRDWILTRILWLRGEEPGVNQGGAVDTYQRCIYIHGAPDDVPMGAPGSAGCIRMRNADVIELFDLAAAGCPVDLFE